MKKIPLHSGAVSAEGGEDEWAESFSEENFGSVGGEEISCGAIALMIYG